MSSGQGERTTETVSHTVPNMASADQSPHQSIARNTRPHKQNSFFFFFFFLSCFAGNVPRKKQQQLTESGTVHSIKSTVYNREERGTWVEGRELDGGLGRNKSPRGGNGRPMRSVRTENTGRKGDGGGIKKRPPPPFHPPCCALRHPSTRSSRSLQIICPRVYRTRIFSLDRIQPITPPIRSPPLIQNGSSAEKHLGRRRRWRSGPSQGWSRGFFHLIFFQLRDQSNPGLF